MEPRAGDTATCSMCGATIVYVSPYWRHTGEIQPRHPAWPHELTRESLVNRLINAWDGDHEELMALVELLNRVRARAIQDTVRECAAICRRRAGPFPGTGTLQVLVDAAEEMERYP